MTEQPGQKLIAIGFAAGGGLPEHDAPAQAGQDSIALLRITTLTAAS